MSKTFGNSRFYKITDAKFTQYPPGTCYLVCVRLIAEESGFSIYAPKLPGAASQGDSLEEALANITDALIGCLQSYKADGLPIPWLKVAPDLLAGELERFVTVDIRTEEERHGPR